MKNVEGWVVGTYYGEPIYKTLPEDTLIEPRMREWYIHNSYKEASKRLDCRLEEQVIYATKSFQRVNEFMAENWDTAIITVI